ncbi:MAG: hypothetical protein EOP33_01960 [Rickettsiaceae bacterium]|nr:MAG: hypothetical protein EOP33_01960 [Rickettsiaceae bacterium]
MFNRVTKGWDKKLSKAMGAPEGTKISGLWSNDPNKRENAENFFNGNTSVPQPHHNMPVTQQQSDNPITYTPESDLLKKKEEEAAKSMQKRQEIQKAFLAARERLTGIYGNNDDTRVDADKHSTDTSVTSTTTSTQQSEPRTEVATSEQNRLTNNSVSVPTTKNATGSNSANVAATKPSVTIDNNNLIHTSSQIHENNVGSNQQAITPVLTSQLSQDESNKTFELQNDQNQALLEEIKAVVDIAAIMSGKTQLLTSIYAFKNVIELIEFIKDYPKVANQELLLSIRTILTQHTTSAKQLYSITTLDSFEKLLDFVKNDLTTIQTPGNDSLSNEANKSVENDSTTTSSSDKLKDLEQTNISTTQDNLAQTPIARENSNNFEQYKMALAQQASDLELFEMFGSIMNAKDMTQLLNIENISILTDSHQERQGAESEKVKTFEQKSSVTPEPTEQLTSSSKPSVIESDKSFVAQNDHNQELLESIKKVMIEDAVNNQMYNVVPEIGALQNFTQLEKFVKDNATFSSYLSSITTESSSDQQSTQANDEVNIVNNVDSSQMNAASIATNYAQDPTTLVEEPVAVNNNVTSSLVNQSNGFGMPDNIVNKCKNLINKQTDDTSLQQAINNANNQQELITILAGHRSVVEEVAGILDLLGIDAVNIEYNADNAHFVDLIGASNHHLASAD